MALQARKIAVACKLLLHQGRSVPAFFGVSYIPFTLFDAVSGLGLMKRSFLRLSGSNRFCGWIRICESGAGQCEKVAASQIVYKHN